MRMNNNRSDYNGVCYLLWSVEQVRLTRKCCALLIRDDHGCVDWLGLGTIFGDAIGPGQCWVTGTRERTRNLHSLNRINIAYNPHIYLISICSATVERYCQLIKFN